MCTSYETELLKEIDGFLKMKGSDKLKVPAAERPQQTIKCVLVQPLQAPASLGMPSPCVMCHTSLACRKQRNALKPAPGGFEIILFTVTCYKEQRIKILSDVFSLATSYLTARALIYYR